MNINRHNYEEFFLLYIDNELSDAGKKAVDVFVHENPDLQGELLLLQQAVLKADDIVLEKKDWLFMHEGITALQENLLLYADDELSPSENKAVEALLAIDNTASAEWNILRQTKLQPDTSVVFTDKQSLYRTETRRIVVFKWWRVAAAAILLGFGLWTGVALYKNNFKTTSTDEAGITKNSKTKPGQTKIEEPENTIVVETQPTGIAQVQNTTTAVLPKNIKGKTVEKNTRQKPTEQNDNIAVKNSNKKPSNNLPKSYFENINRKESNEIVRTNVLPRNNNNITGSGVNDVIVKTNPAEKITNPVIPDPDKGITDPATTTAIPVVYIADGNNNNRFLDMDESKGKRTMLGGFLRKAKRIVERTTNIKTGDGLKVAGFEIALK